MKIYNIKLRVNGELFTEVRKQDVTAAEIAVLSFLHKGADAIVECEECGSVKRSDRAERKRLAANYHFGELPGAAIVQRLFGVDTLPLPQEYTPVVEEDVTDAILEGDEDDDKEVIVRTVVAAPLAEKPQPMRNAKGQITKNAVTPADILA